MSKDVFGSPDAGDPTAEWEQVVEETAREHAEMFNVAKNEIMNRPLGSKRVPRAEQEMEWNVYRQVPGMLVQFFQDKNMTVEEAINYAHDMEKRPDGRPSGRTSD